MMQTQVKINGIDVTSYLVNYEYEKGYGDVISQIEMEFVKTLSGVIDLVTGLTIEVWRGIS